MKKSVKTKWVKARRYLRVRVTKEQIHRALGLPAGYIISRLSGYFKTLPTFDNAWPVDSDSGTFALPMFDKLTIEIPKPLKKKPELRTQRANRAKRR